MVSKIVWLEGFILIIKNLHRVQWFQQFQSNSNNFLTSTWFIQLMRRFPIKSKKKVFS